MNAPADPPLQEEPAPALHVLVVDPQAGQAALVRDFLLAEGHRVSMTHDWRLAEAMLTQRVIQAVVMAAATPGVRRRSAAQLMRAGPARWAGLPLVALAPGIGRREAELAHAEGFDTLVARPFGAAELAAALREAVRLRKPPLLLDAAHRAGLRLAHGPAALAARDEAALGRVAQVLAPLMTGDPAEAELRAAVATVADAMAEVGALHLAGLARRIGEGTPRGARSLHPLLQVATATRFALRDDRVAAARLDPIWAASDISPGEKP